LKSAIREPHSPIQALDAHCHCGRQDFPPAQDYETIAALHRAAGVDAAWIFPPVYEVYDRHDPAFTDSAEWQARRRCAHDYLLALAARRTPPAQPPPTCHSEPVEEPLRGVKPGDGSGPCRVRQAPERCFERLSMTDGGMAGPVVFPFFFVWNDFDLAGLTAEYRGIKWHRHPDEPVYRYDDPRCRAILDAITERRLPIVLEESFDNTMRFLDELAPQAIVVIPHCGYLNGGFWRLHGLGVWRRPNVYADSSAAPSHEPAVLRAFLDAYGPEKLLYGSDYPFDSPAFCLGAIRALGLPPADEALIVAGNALRLAGANGA